MSICLFRQSNEQKEEYAAAESVLGEFQITPYRNMCIDQVVFGRYSVLPFYRELELDLFLNGSKLINSYEQHKYISDFQYYDDIKDLTFKTWNKLEDVPLGKFLGYGGHGIVVKGRTNSRKHRFLSSMYAADVRTAALIAHELKDDVLIGPQGIIYREYTPLKTFEIGLNGQRFANEWRFFILNGSIVDYGYYWSLLGDLSLPYTTSETFRVVFDCIYHIGNKVNFYVIDVAETEDGRWMVVELNDGQMSGLSMIDPIKFYQSLKNQWRNICV